MVPNDLHVQPISDSLEGYHIDLVISGSIGAVESVRFIRALRRLKAEVYPLLTKGAQLFTTSTAVTWAAARQVTVDFEGTATHLGQRDACVVAPASASIISKVSQGITDTPATALIASYLGQKKPVFFLPNMHDSLMDSPFIVDNMKRLKLYAEFLEGRQEEGKQKFPDPATLADLISHKLRLHAARSSILVTMGTTRGYIDTIRYISNYSSGALGAKITEEFYRQGYSVKVVSGPCPVQPKTYSQLICVDTHDEMSEAVESIMKSSVSGAIFAASVLDFIPDKKIDRKVRSTEDLQVKFKKTDKIIGKISQHLPFKVGFKLESSLTSESSSIAREYLTKYQLTHLVMNQQSDVSQKSHLAFVYTPNNKDSCELEGKEKIARYLVKEADQIFKNAAINN